MLDNVGTLAAGSEVTSPRCSKSRQRCIHRGKQPRVLSGRFAHVFFFPPEVYLLLPHHVLTQGQIREKIAMLSQAILPVERLCHAAPDGQPNIPVPWQGLETAKVVSVCPPP